MFELFNFRSMSLDSADQLKQQLCFIRNFLGTKETSLLLMAMFLLAVFYHGQQVRWVLLSQNPQQQRRTWVFWYRSKTQTRDRPARSLLLLIAAVVSDYLCNCHKSKKIVFLQVVLKYFGDGYLYLFGAGGDYIKNIYCKSLSHILWE